MKKKYKYVLGVIAGGLLLGTVFFQSDKMPVIEIERPGYGKEDQKHKLLVDENGNENEVEIVVKAQDIPEENLQEAFDETYEDILIKIKGNNSSLERIESNLNFVEQAGKYGMEVQYYPEDYDIIDSFGGVHATGLTEPVTKTITASIMYKDLIQTYDIKVVICPAVNETNHVEELENKINDTLNENLEDGVARLPESIDGISVNFYSKGTSRVTYFFLFILAAVVFVYYQKIYKPKTDREKRVKELMQDYPEIVSKISLLMAAGMSSRNAFTRIVNDYQLNTKKNNKKRCAYEEIKICVNKMSSGIMETEAYREFGKNCGVTPYIKLSNYLIQNIQKGTCNIFELLKDETEKAFEERKAGAKKMGEEAGTKLLIPMIMSLFVVLIIIIVPAFMSF